jgi:hypothetical protein
LQVLPRRCGPAHGQKGIYFMDRLILSVLLLIAAVIPSEAALRTGSVPEYLRSLSCRVVSRTQAGSLQFPPIVDVSLNTTSERAGDYTFDASLHNGKVLTSRIQHVYVKMPRDRFNVTLLLDGKPLMRMNHIDLDIYVETTIDGIGYALHCFGDHP